MAEETERELYSEFSADRVRRAGQFAARVEVNLVHGRYDAALETVRAARDQLDGPPARRRLGLDTPLAAVVDVLPAGADAKLVRRTIEAFARFDILSVGDLLKAGPQKASLVQNIASKSLHSFIFALLEFAFSEDHGPGFVDD